VTPGGRPVAAGSERLARAVVSGCAVLVVAAYFGFSFGNVLALGRYLGVPEWVAWLVAPAVDLTVVGLIVGVRYLSLRGVEGRRLRPARLLLIAAGLATWALNTAHALLVRHHLGVVAYDSLAPLLLIGWAEVGPWFLRQFGAAAPAGLDRSAVVADAGPVQATGLDQPADLPSSPPTSAAVRTGPDRATPVVDHRRPVIQPMVPAADGQPSTGAGEVRERARRILRADPQVSGAELARLLGVSEGYGRRLRRELAAAVSAATNGSVGPAGVAGPSRSGGQDRATNGRAAGPVLVPAPASAAPAAGVASTRDGRGG
jgi:hypothetical protein